jgi:serine phosphatase RsbU (regulator of sigma subunit)
MMQTNAIKYLRCMEVWGGNRSVDTGVIMPAMDAWVYSQPCQNQVAGGDVHYVSTCAGGILVRLALADIAGHGAGVAETGAHLRQLMRRFVNQVDQRSMVRSLNREFTALSSNGLFATAVVMTFDSRTNTLLISNAGHPLPLWYQGKNRRWTTLQPQTAAAPRAGTLPWGIEHDSGGEQFEVQLDIGDVIVCYTDALAESKDATGAFLGTAGLLRLADEIGGVAPSQLIPRLLSSIARNDPHYAARDDVTCLVFHPTGLRPTVPPAIRAALTLPARRRMFGVAEAYGSGPRRAIKRVGQ